MLLNFCFDLCKLQRRIGSGKNLEQSINQKEKIMLLLRKQGKYIMIATNIKIGLIILRIQEDSMDNLVKYNNEFLASKEKQMWLQGKTFARV